MKDQFKDQFVTQEIAARLKDKGFDERCMASYNHNQNNLLVTSAFLVHRNSTHPNGNVMAPTYQHAMGWLHRNGYNIHDYWIANAEAFGCDVYTIKGDLLFPHETNYSKLFEKIEDAWNVAINEALNKM